MSPEFEKLLQTYVTNDRDVMIAFGMAVFFLGGYWLLTKQPYQWITRLHSALCLILYLAASTLISGVKP